MVVASQTSSPTGLLDLRIYLGAAGRLADGGSIYSYADPTYGLGSTYPPVWSVLLLPLSRLDVHAVELGWTTIGLAAWFVTIRLAQRRREDTGFRTLLLDPGRADYAVAALIWLLSLFTAPVWNTINQGQVNFLLWLAIVADLVAVHRRRPSAGVWVGVATAIKLTPAIFGLAYLLAGRWRAAIRSALAFVAVTAVGALAWSDSVRYWTELLFESGRVGDLFASENNSLAGLLSRLGVADGTAVAIGALAGLALLVACRRSLAAAFDGGRTVWIAVTVGSIGALLSPVSWTHHLIFLALILIPIAQATSLRVRTRWLLIAAVEVALIDPIGFGRLSSTSSARTVGLLVLTGALMAHAARRPSGPTEPSSRAAPDPAADASTGAGAPPSAR